MFVNNPKTQKPIKVGGRVYNQLVHEGLLANEYTDPKVLYEVKETEQVSDKIKDIDKELHPTEQAVRGRGKYKDKIVVRKKQPSIVDMAKITSKKAINVMKDEKQVQRLNDIDEEDWEHQLHNMIVAELQNPEVGTKEPIKKLTPLKKVSLKQKKRYKEVHPKPILEEEEGDTEEEYNEN